MSQATVTPNKGRQLNRKITVTLSSKNTVITGGFESIINYDRLCRTVHMLNYLTLSHLQGVLFLEVDPRHILGIKHDHGAYFEEVIVRCGLETKNVAIVLAVNNQYAHYYQELIKGLENYRNRGYQLALKFEYLTQVSETFDLISKISPNYISLSARNMENKVHDEELLTRLHQLKNLVDSLGGKSILQQVDEKKFDLLARKTAIDLVEGGYYYRAIPFDYLSNTKFDQYGLRASN